MTTTSPEVNDVIACFKSLSELIRRAAFEQTAKLEPDAEFVEPLIEALKQENGCLKTYRLILDGLKIHGKDSEMAQTALSPLLHHESEQIRIAIAETFFLVGGDVNQALMPVVFCLKSVDFSVQLVAVAALNTFAKAALPAAGFLADMAIDASLYNKVRVGALCVLYSIGSGAVYFSPKIAKCLIDSDPEVVCIAIDTLIETGVHKDAVPYLIAALNYQDPKTKEFRNRHCGRMFMGGEDMHQEVSKLLGTLGSQAIDAIPVLEELLQRATSETEAKQRLIDAVEAHNAPIVAQLQEVKPRDRSGKQALSRKMTTFQRELREHPLRHTSERAQIAAREALAAIRGEVSNPPQQ